jgi:putative Holliday junction resolvase
MHRILALDLGDVWVGTALSDPLGIVCRPLETVMRKEIISFLKRAIPQHQVGLVLVGLPAGSQGQENEQTIKTRTFFERCLNTFPETSWELLDEYLTSQLAVGHQQVVKNQKRSAESKRQSHSLAAAFLLRDYLHSKMPLADEID